MPTTTVHLLRHGAHDLLGRRLCGRDDPVSLNAAGIVQARSAAAWLARRGTQQVISSPVSRAWETAGYVAAAAGVEPLVEMALVEIDFGAWTGCSFDELAGRADWTAWNVDRGRRPAGSGETMVEVQARVGRWIETLHGRGGSLVAVSHADVIKAAVAHVLGLPLQFHDRFEIAPGSITTVVLDAGGGVVQALNERPDA